MSGALLETCGLGYRYLPDRWALQDVNLHLGLGERVAVLGANGAGKSTLLLALAGVLSLTEGQLRWEGQPVKDGKSRSFLRDKVGLLLQDPEDQLFAPTVEQDVAFGLLQRGLPDSIALDRAQSALDRLRIRHLAKRPVQQLSLGEKKRVALAGLIVLRPALLLLDEPSSGLDHDGTRALFEVLSELQTDGTAVVLSTHDADLAAQWTPRVVVLDSGQIEGDGTREDILSNRAILERARVAPPLTYVAALALRELYPPSVEWTLPATPLELVEFVRRIRKQTEGAPR